MTEQEKLHHAKHYIDSLANGLNPLDGTPIPEQDIVNNVKISRCLFFVSDVLRKQLDGHEPKKVSEKDKKLFYINLPIETHNLLNYIKESEPYKKHAEALHLKISYLTAQNELKKSRNSAILNVLLYIISLLSAIGTLDVIEAHFGVPFKYSFIIVVTLFILGLFWGIIEYRNHRKL